MSGCRFQLKIDDYLLGRLNEKETDEFEEHIFDCEACFEDLKFREEIIRVIKEKGKDIFLSVPEPESVRQSSRSFLRFKPWWPVAALAAAAVLLVALLPRAPRGTPRFTLSQEDVVRGEVLELVPASIRLGHPPYGLEWKALSREARYEVFLYEDALLWSGTTENNRIILPGTLVKELQPGKIYTWEVKAFSPQGILLASSPRKPLRFTEN